MCTPSRAIARTASVASSGPAPPTTTTPRPRPSANGSATSSLQRENRCNTVITMPKDTNATAAPPVPPSAKLTGWFAGRLPDGWFAGPPAVSHDRDEIVVLGTLPTPTVTSDGADVDAEVLAAACRARIQGFWEDTRALR